MVDLCEMIFVDAAEMRDEVVFSRETLDEEVVECLVVDLHVFDVAEVDEAESSFLERFHD